MSLISSLIGILLTLLHQPYPLQDDQISFRTVSIYNQDYLADELWECLPVNRKTGEDVNSVIYGGIHYPPYGNKKPIDDDQLSIARGVMEIEIDLENPTNKIWLIESIELKIDKICGPAGKPGKWKLATRSNDFYPVFHIDPAQESVTYLVKEEVKLLPNEAMQDTYSIFEVRVPLSPDDPKIYQFSFRLTFSSIGGTRETFHVKSDKPYFIGS